MARFDTSGIDDIIDQMRRMGEMTGEMADEMLLAGAEEVKEAWRQSAIQHDLKETGDMIESIDYAREPIRVGDVKAIDIYPRGKDRKGVRNAEKAFRLHYGWSKFIGTRWVDDADRWSEETAPAAMREVFEKYMMRR